QDETRRLLDAIDSKRDYAIFLLAYRHGLRASEVGNLATAYNFKPARHPTPPAAPRASPRRAPAFHPTSQAQTETAQVSPLHQTAADPAEKIYLHDQQYT